MAYRNNNAEGGSENSAVSANQTGSGSPFDSIYTFSNSNTSFLTYSTFTKMHGAQSYRFVTSTTSDIAFVQYNEGVPSADASIRFYVCMNSLPASAVRVATIRSSAGTVAGVNIGSNYKPTIVNTSGTAILVAVNALTVGVWYRIEMNVGVRTTSTGIGSLATYVGDSLGPIEPPLSTTVGNFGTSNINGVQIGKVTGTPAVADLSFDDIAFDVGNQNFIGPIPPIEILQESFVGLGIAATRWTVVQGSGAVSQADGKITFTLGSNTDPYTYTYIESPRTYNLANSKIFVECVDFVNPTQGAEQQLVVQLDDQHVITLMFDGNNLGYGYTLPAGAGSTNYKPRDTVQHRWLQIRETNGFIYWETSPDQLQWTTHGSIATPFDVSFVKVRLRAGTWKSVSGPGVASFDNLNIGIAASLPWLHA